MFSFQKIEEIENFIIKEYNIKIEKKVKLNEQEKAVKRSIQERQRERKNEKEKLLSQSGIIQEYEHKYSSLSVIGDVVNNERLKIMLFHIKLHNENKILSKTVMKNLKRIDEQLTRQLKENELLYEDLHKMMFD